MIRLHRTLLGLAILALVGSTGCPSSEGTPTTRNADQRSPEPISETIAEEVDSPDVRDLPRRGTYPSFADVVERVRPAVVNIYTRTRVATQRYYVGPGRRLVPEQRRSESLGSGFIMDPDGRVLTNYHVIRDATEIEVRLFDERRFKAKVIGEDPKTDVALLQLEDARGLPALEFGDSEDLRVGDWVVAIGNPLGLTSTVTAGIASATGRRDIPVSGDLRYQDFIQTDASINPGNSGGPLVDIRGRVVGINTLVNAAAQGIGFAIPINMVKELMPKLSEGGRVQRSWLGIYIDEVPDPLRAQIGLPDEGGALVKGVVKGGPGEKARLAAGDVILELGGEDIENADQLSWVAGNYPVGKEVEVEVRRGSQNIELSVRLGALPD